MRVEDLIHACLADPDALTGGGLEASRARLAEAHAALRTARATLEAAEAAVSGLDGRQAALTQRIAELNSKRADRRPLLGLTRKPEALTAAAKRFGDMQRDHAFLVAVLEVMVAGERLPAALAVKRAELEVARAERQWVYAQTEIQIRELFGPLSMATSHDPELEITLAANSQVSVLLRDLSARDADIHQREEEIKRDESFVTQQQQAMGLL